MTLRANWFKLTVVCHSILWVVYLVLGTSSIGWTNAFYTMEKGMTILTSFFVYQETKTLADKLFLNYSIINQLFLWVFFIACSFLTKLEVIALTYGITAIIISALGSVIVTWYHIRRMLK